MVGGTTPSRVIQVRFPESCPQPSLAKQAVLTHRPGYFCLDNAFALIDGAIQKNDRNATASSNRHILCVRRECEQSKAAEKACAVREGVWSQSRQGGTRTTKRAIAHLLIGLRFDPLEQFQTVRENLR